MYAAIEGPGLGNGAAGSQQQVVPALLRRFARDAHARLFEVQALADGQAQALGAVFLDEARHQRCGQLVGVGHPVQANVAVLGKQLGVIEARAARIEQRDIVLVLVRRVHVEQARLERLRGGLAEQRSVALEHQAAVERHRRDRARQLGRLVQARCVLVKIVLGRVVHQLGRDEPARAHDRITDLALDHGARAAHVGGVGEAGRLGVDRPVEARHVVARRTEVNLRQAVVRPRHRQAWIGGGRRVLQHLVILGARGQAPVLAGVIGAQFAQQLALGAGGDGARKVGRVFIVRCAMQVPAVRPARPDRAVVQRIGAPARGAGFAVVRQHFDVGFAAVGAAQVTAGRAHLETAVEHHARVQRQVAVRCDVDVVRHHHLGLALRAEADGRRQPARTALARQRERHCRRAQDRHVLEIDDRLAGGADVAALVQAQRARFQVPVGIRPFAGAVGTVAHDGLLFTQKVDPARLALGIVRRHEIRRVEQVALARFEVQLQLVALVAVAKAPHVDVAGGRDLVFDDQVAGRVGGHAGLAARDLDVTGEIEPAVGPAGDILGLDGDGKFVLGLGRWCRGGDVDGGGRLGERRHRSDRSHCIQCEHVSWWEWLGRGPAHGKSQLMENRRAP